MNRAYGSLTCVIYESSVGTINIVTTDFNPLKTNTNYKMNRAYGSLICLKYESSVGTTNVVTTDFNPLETKTNYKIESLRLGIFLRKFINWLKKTSSPQILP